MTVKQNSKMPSGIIRILLSSGLVVFFMLSVTLGISCQAPVPAEEEATPPSNEIEISSFSFLPATVTVTVGTTITWSNLDSVTHTVTSETDLFDSGNLARKATFSHSFTDHGTFSYYCTIHPQMRGKVIVE